MAIARPMLEWVLVEANGRKAMFLEEATRALGLERVRVHRGRYQGMRLPQRVDLVTCRAVKLEPKTQRKLVSSLSTKGRFLWFGAEKRLETARRDLRPDAKLKVEPPRRLLETTPTSWLLVTEKRAGSG